jgi:protein TonB
MGTVVDAASLKILKKVSPEYPVISRRRKEEGTVTLLAEVASGRVTAVHVEKGSGHSPLDESAVRALRQWRFDTSGYGERLTVRIPFVFSLR